MNHIKMVHQIDTNVDTCQLLVTFDSKSRKSYTFAIIKTFLYSKFAPAETFFSLERQYRMLSYINRSWLPKIQVKGRLLSYLCSIFFLEETFVFQILVLLRCMLVLQADGSPKMFHSQDLFCSNSLGLQFRPYSCLILKIS